MIAVSIAVLGGLALVFAVMLTVASRRLAVTEDPLVARIEALLPGTNCGACGFAGCRTAAEKLALREADAAACVAGGEETAAEIAAVLGVEPGAMERRVAVVHCQGGTGRCGERFTYLGVESCLAGHLTAGGPKKCAWGCLGLGDCARACPFDALAIGPDRLPVVDESACVGCGRCVAACPRKIITLLSREHHVYLGCVSRGRGRAVKAACTVGCIACGICAKQSAEGAVAMEDNLPRLNYGAGDDFSRAAGRCPMKCFVRRGQSFVS